MTPERWQKVRELCLLALERGPGERGGFLAANCPDDEPLRHQVESLIARATASEGMPSLRIWKELEADAALALERDPNMLGVELPMASNPALPQRYRIIERIGAGGMGEVFLAHDSLLERRVALKLLPAQMSADPVARERLRREAIAAAALDHPYICKVYEVGEEAGSVFIAMEYLQGQTLRARLQSGPITCREGLRIAAELAEAIEEAHSAHLIHRDLKPANIMLTGQKHIKVMDFGIAKRLPLNGGAEQLLTEEVSLTATGKIIGTPDYMSPEQLAGAPVDNRSDLFAFGIILCEILAGKHPFRRGSATATISAILCDPPSVLISGSGELSPGLMAVIRRLLAKEPGERYQSIVDARADLATEAVSIGVEARPSAVKQIGRDAERDPLLRHLDSTRRGVVWSIALIAVILLATVAWFEFGNGKSGALLRISEYTQLTHNGHTGYVAGTDGSRVYLTHFLPFSIEEVAVSGGEIERVASIKVPNPFLWGISPDGSSLLVQSWGADTPSLPLYAVQIVDGAYRYLADVMPAGATWSPDGKLVAYATPNGDLNLVNSDGTGAHKLASVGADANALSWSPDGSTIRFTRDASIWEISSSGSNLHQLLLDWHPSGQKCCGNWSPDGKFFVFLAGAFGPGQFPEAQIYAIDERRGLFRRPAKAPVQLTSGPVEWSPPVFSKDGTKIFATGSTKRGELVRFDTKSGQFQPFLDGISADLIAFSKDGQFVAYVTYPDGTLWRANRDGSDRVQLTSSPLQPQSVQWSPEGTRLVFEALSPEGPHAWIVRSTGGSPQRLVPEDSGPEREPSWSPDGRAIYFATGDDGSHESHIRTLDLTTHQINTLAGSDGKIGPRWSPDGRFINASSLDVSTTYVFDVKTQRWSALNIGPSAFASWSSDSRSLYFMRYATDPAILRIPVTGGEAKLVVSLKNFPITGTQGVWFGLDPTDAPLMLRDVSTTDVYALTLEEK